MNDSNKIVKSAITAILTLTIASAVTTTANAAMAQKMERCYGIVKAGMNDCKTATASCAGSSTKDNQPDAFVFVPQGLCDKIVGGSLAAKTASDTAKK